MQPLSAAKLVASDLHTMAAAITKVDWSQFVEIQPYELFGNAHMDPVKVMRRGLLLAGKWIGTFRSRRGSLLLSLVMLERFARLRSKKPYPTVQSTCNSS